MINIYMSPPMGLDIQKTILPPSEWDVRTIVGGRFLGVIEDSDDGFMFTDSFGHLTTFFDGEEMLEVMRWVDRSINERIVH